MNTTHQLTEEQTKAFCQETAIGVVSPCRSNPITPNEFTFWIAATSSAKFLLQIGDIVVAKHTPKTQGDLWDQNDQPDLTFGVITGYSLVSETESPLYAYMQNGIGKQTKRTKNKPVDVQVVTCKMLRSFTGRMRPVDSCPVFFATQDGIRFALQEIDETRKPQQAGNWIPLGLYKSGYGISTPICANENFLLGSDAAHLNVTGQSGMATKTSYLLFSIASILQKTSRKVGVIFVNVKKSDYLFVDKPNPVLTESDHTMYEALDLEPKLPLNSCGFWAPTHSSGKVMSLRTEAAAIALAWQDFHPYIPTLLKADMDVKAEGVFYGLIEQMEMTKANPTFDEALKRLGSDTKTAPDELGHSATVQKVYHRLKRLREKFKGAMDPTATNSKFPNIANLKHQDAIVLDLALIKEPEIQQVVFKHLLQQCEQVLRSPKGENTDRVDNIIVVCDELNQFCPHSVSDFAPLRTQIIDIAARGRSAGFLLFSAQQAASGIAKEVFGAASTRIIGRTGAEEITAGIYQFLSPDLKGQITKLPKGRMIAYTSTCPEYLPISFPNPPVETDKIKPTAE